MARILCFGDSNTYGYDPRGYLGGRFAQEVRWTGRLRSAGWEVCNCGQNGRCIPSPGEAGLLTDRLTPAPDTVTVMLGTNDLLMDTAHTAEDAAAHMGAFLRAVTVSLSPEALLLIAPVPMIPGEWVTEDRIVTESNRLGETYAALAAALGVRFADAAGWGVALGFDGVHFTEAGHAAFAAGLLKALGGA